MTETSQKTIIEIGGSINTTLEFPTSEVSWGDVEKALAAKGISFNNLVVMGFETDTIYFQPNAAVARTATIRAEDTMLFTTQAKVKSGAFDRSDVLAAVKELTEKRPELLPVFNGNRHYTNRKTVDLVSLLEQYDENLAVDNSADSDLETRIEDLELRVKVLEEIAISSPTVAKEPEEPEVNVFKQKLASGDIYYPDNFDTDVDDYEDDEYDDEW